MGFQQIERSNGVTAIFVTWPEIHTFAGGAP